ncbi:MAG TPA: MMPL family transporter [Candidatus Limnocylindrales bacterium]|nr:MMPL family transporter [Candidatus Limnocylindrales bacterium]
MSRFFTRLGSLVVRFRYLVVVAWIVGAVLAVTFLPSLSDVAKDTTSGFLPADAPSMEAAAMAAPFQDISLAPATLVVAREGALTAADNAAVDRLEARIRGIDRVKVVLDLGISRDGEARQALIEASVVAFTSGPQASAVVDSIRDAFTTVDAPAGLQMHLTGQLALQVDSVAASGASEDQTSQLSLLFIVVLLLLAFRAILAPLVTLIPAAFVLVAAGPVIAESTKIGVQVSSITQLLLIVLILGAGTDYGVFLVFRVREELRRGLSPHEAVVRAVSRVGESITFSALTVICALLSLVVAEFAFYQSLGPALAIGIALMLLAGLTLLPALLAILGRAVFWPSGVAPRPDRGEGLWDRIGVIATRHPGRTLVAGVILFVALGSTVLTTGVAGFGDITSTASGTDSAAGDAVIAAHFPSSSTGRSAVLMRFPTSVWDDPSVLQPAQAGVAGLAEFSGLVGPLNPNGVPLTVDQLTQLHTTLGPARALPPVAPSSAVPQQLYDAYRATGQLISPDGQTIQFSVVFAGGDASSPAVLDSVPAMREDVTKVAQGAGAAESGVYGAAEFAADVSRISGSDLQRIIPIVALLIAVLLAIVLRSLVAPIYLVASIVLSYLAALGLVGIVFVHLGGQDGISFILPFLMFVFLMALGSDYNILIMSRIREEAHELPLRQAVARAIGRTGSTITTAGVILGGTFAVLAVAGSSAGGGQIQQIGYGVAAGVLMDTFLLRSLLVPSLVVLLDRWNWWPSRLARAEGGSDTPVEDAAGA